MNTRILTALFVTAPFLFSFTSCASAPQAGNGEVASADKSKSEDKKDDAEKKAQELVDKQLELRLAKMELEVKRTTTQHSIQTAEEAAETARLELEKAEKALVVFRDMDKPKRAREMEIRVQRSEFGIENQEQDLQQMVDDYEGQEEFYAKRTGEIVIWRTRKQLDFARANLELAAQSRNKLMAHTLPDEEKDLARKLALKKSAHERAVQKVANANIEAEVGLLRAEAKIEKLMREIKAATKELES